MTSLTPPHGHRPHLAGATTGKMNLFNLPGRLLWEGTGFAHLRHRSPSTAASKDAWDSGWKTDAGQSGREDVMGKRTVNHRRPKTRTEGGWRIEDRDGG